MRFNSRREALLVLGLAEGAGDEAVKSAYRALVKIYHPDVRGDETSLRRYRAICEAYEYLSAAQPSVAVWATSGPAMPGHRVFGSNEDIVMMRSRMQSRAEYAKIEIRADSSKQKSRADEFVEKARAAKQERAYRQAMDKIHTERAAEVMAQIVKAYLQKGE